MVALLLPLTVCVRDGLTDVDAVLDSVEETEREVVPQCVALAHAVNEADDEYEGDSVTDALVQEDAELQPLTEGEREGERVAVEQADAEGSPVRDPVLLTLTVEHGLTEEHDDEDALTQCVCEDEGECDALLDADVECVVDTVAHCEDELDVLPLPHTVTDALPVVEGESEVQALGEGEWLEEGEPEEQPEGEIEGLADGDGDGLDDSDVDTEGEDVEHTLTEPQALALAQALKDALLEVEVDTETHGLAELVTLGEWELDTDALEHAEREPEAEEQCVGVTDTVGDCDRLPLVEDVSEGDMELECVADTDTDEESLVLGEWDDVPQVVSVGEDELLVDFDGDAVSEGESVDVSDVLVECDAEVEDETLWLAQVVGVKVGDADEERDVVGHELDDSVVVGQ